MTSLYWPTSSTAMVQELLVNSEGLTESQAAQAVSGLVDADIEPGTEGFVAALIAEKVLG